MRVHERIYMSSTHGRSYVIEGDDGLVMIDTYTHQGVRGVLREFAEEDGLDLTGLKALLLTHMHYDHAAGAAYVRATCDVPVVCHALDVAAIVGHDTAMVASRIPWTESREIFPACTIDHLVEGGDVIRVAGLELGVAHLPGHTRGGVAYLWDQQCFCGDTLLPGGRIGWSDIHWGSNLADHADSIRRLRQLMPQRIYGGHGDPEDLTPESLALAEENVRRLVDVGLASSVSERAPLSPAGSSRAIEIGGIPERPEAAPRQLAPSLARAPQLEVAAGRLQGTIRPMGELHGLILHGDDSAPITRPGAATMNLEHYCRTGACGAFVPRKEAAQAYETAADRATVHFAPAPEWQVSSRVSYAARGDDAFDILFGFDFDRDYERFEAFVASYFWGGVVPYVAAGGRCFRPEIERGQQLFFPRDEDARAQVGDGRWEFLERGSLYAGCDAQGSLYDAPVTIHWPDGAERAFVQMVDRRECAAVSVNTFAYAQDFSLIGRDVRQGETVEVRARVAYCRATSPDDIMALYRGFQAEMDEGREPA